MEMGIKILIVICNVLALLIGTADFAILLYYLVKIMLYLLFPKNVSDREMEKVEKLDKIMTVLLRMAFACWLLEFIGLFILYMKYLA